MGLGENVLVCVLAWGVGCVVGRSRVMGGSRRDGPDGVSTTTKMYCCCWVSYYWRSLVFVGMI